MESEGVSQAATSDPEAAKQEARSMLEAGSTIEEIAVATGLGRNQILGIKGSLAKANKKALEKTEAEPSDLGKADDEEKSLIADFKGENTLAASAVVLARNKSMLRQTDPTLYNSLFPSGQPESNASRTLVDLETARLIRVMRQEEEHRNNGDGAEASETALLRKELETVKEEMRKKDVEELKGQINELRQDLRHSTGSNSDLAVVVKEASGLLEKIVETNGPLRSYLMPNTVDIRPPNEAPELRRQVVEDGRPSVASELGRHGLATRIIERRP